ncbi:PREDICTED: receptor-like protein kinase FERONIA [Prunus mume]|uniref:Receptor-like protein kinase FERONIA n=1 Tax=Prunus mume TaxID=102107 RepID=A0ABM0NWV4_PRUMU|nr:PREDICTED: receptor-like protein kinase FERONIA [Prunus mume]
MNNFSISNYLSLFLSTIVILLVAAGDSPPIYTPVEDFTVKCGYSGNKISEDDGRNWIGDINSKFSPLERQAVGNTSIFKQAPHSNTVQQVPYTTVRLSRSEFSYSFELTSGPKFIRLYFNPVSYGPDFDRSKALFSVKAGGFNLLHDFNASVTADASRLDRIYKEFCLNMDKEESLNITFTPSITIPDAYAFINGIEIVSMPAHLYYGVPKSGRLIEIIDTGRYFSLDNSTALEMVSRINVGGNSISSNQDTGMYRNWDGFREERNYLDNLSLTRSVLTQNLSIQLNFSEIPAYTAPKQVYQTARSMETNVTMNEIYVNLTWEFPVDSMFSYLVRLHFCQFQFATIDQWFYIYIANQTTSRYSYGGIPGTFPFDFGNETPFYNDYRVFMSGPGPESKVNLSIALELVYSNENAWLNGLEIFKLIYQSGNLADPDPPKGTTSSSKIPKNKGRTRMLAIVAGIVSGVLVLSVFTFLVFRQRWKVKSSGSTQGTTKSTKTYESSLPSDLCRSFSLTEIKAATQNFNKTLIIGVGGFGNVYKGCIDGGATLVAIKRLKPESSQGAHEFKTEIELLSQLRHRHLVSLIGFCTDKGEMILVYDYMARGTLGGHLYRSDNPPLSWEQRLQICIGAAQGLCYLHSGAKGSVIHRDVKSTNILLDEKWVAKVSDFGLSKMGTTTMSKTHISTAVKGSFGYLDPEYYRCQRLTEKSDVYSFGVVLCEVLCGKPALIHTAEGTRMSLPEWARRCHRDGELDQIIDPSLRGMIVAECLNKFGEIAVSCIQDNGVDRPSMNDVLRELELALQLHQKSIGIKGVAFYSDTAAKASSSELTCATDQSIQRISGTIFSEINDPNGR